MSLREGLLPENNLSLDFRKNSVMEWVSEWVNQSFSDRVSDKVSYREASL